MYIYDIYVIYLYDKMYNYIYIYADIPCIFMYICRYHVCVFYIYK